LQELVGGREAFAPFMLAYVPRVRWEGERAHQQLTLPPRYIDEFKFKTIDSEAFREFFCAHYAATPAINDIDWDTWLYKPGAQREWVAHRACRARCPSRCR